MIGEMCFSDKLHCNARDLMGNRPTSIVLIFFFAIAPSHYGTAGDHRFSISGKGALATDSQLFPNPNASDEIARSESIELKSAYGGGLEGRYFFSESNLSVGLNVEYVSANQSYRSGSPFGRQTNIDDGYRVIPVEATLYFAIPISGDPVSIYMGGGGGMYFGKRHYSVNGTNAVSVRSTTGFGIHVIAGFGYRVTEWFGALAEMKFRDLQFEALNAVPGQEPVASRVHTNGIVFQLGGSVYF